MLSFYTEVGISTGRMLHALDHWLVLAPCARLVVLVLALVGEVTYYFLMVTVGVCV